MKKMIMALTLFAFAIPDVAFSQEPPADPVRGGGPPEWVVEAWVNGERLRRPAGPPPWIGARREIAKELGLLGPPPEVIKAWENGKGFDLPGPPAFVLDLLGF